MGTKSVRYRNQLKITGSQDEELSLEEGITLVKKMAEVRGDRSYKNGKQRKQLDQTMDIVVNLGIDPKKADQMLRGAISLPKGTGQSQRVIAFCDADSAEDAKQAGAVEAGAEELIDKISKGWMDFDVAVAHPQMMGKVGKLGRVLGPQGKMPSPKAGTVTPKVVDAVREYSAGKMEYRNDAGGNIHLRVGKVSFSVEDLKANVEALVGHLLKIKPSASRGTYIKGIFLSGQQTPAVRVEVS